MRVLGVDVALRGAAAVFDPAASCRSGMRWQIIDLPTMAEGSRIDAVSLRDWLLRFAPDEAFLENISPYSRGGGEGGGMHKGVIRFIRAAGAVEGTVATCMGKPARLVVPRVWKKYFDLIGGESDAERKEASRQQALKRAPELADLLARKLDHNRAEAALIALYGAAMIERG